mmetsp:Transcript_2132/g.6821  ORF Transcript_2132/g.6821 Transcript_2132/m.6821 type:complete len:253 (-) Transcript_2132:31-789(-)
MCKGQESGREAPARRSEFCYARALTRPLASPMGGKGAYPPSLPWSSDAVAVFLCRGRRQRADQPAAPGGRAEALHRGQQRGVHVGDIPTGVVGDGVGDDRRKDSHERLRHHRACGRLVAGDLPRDRHALDEVADDCEEEYLHILDEEGGRNAQQSVRRILGNEAAVGRRQVGHLCEARVPAERPRELVSPLSVRGGGGEEGQHANHDDIEDEAVNEPHHGANDKGGRHSGGRRRRWGGRWLAPRRRGGREEG